MSDYSIIIYRCLNDVKYLGGGGGLLAIFRDFDKVGSSMVWSNSTNISTSVENNPQKSVGDVKIEVNTDLTKWAYELVNQHPRADY